MLRDIEKLIILIAILTCLSACSSIRVKVESDCIWFEDQTFTQQTKDWLARNPWPDHVRDDLDKVADNNDLYKKHCQ